MKNLVVYKPGRPSWIWWIKKRVTLQNLNFLGLVQGPTGSGKTWSGISIAHMIDPEFDVATQLVFTFQELMKLVNSDWFRKKKIKVVIWDEPQIEISNRTWQSKINKLLNYLLSTFRHQNIILLFCCPYKDFLDSASMKMLHGLFECSRIDYKKKQCILRPKILQYNSNLKKHYYHSLHIATKGKVRKLKQWGVPKPPENLIKIYEERKTAFTSKLNRELETDINSQIVDQKRERDGRKKLTDLQRTVMELLAHKTGKEAAKIMNLSEVSISLHKKAAEKKGYEVKEFK